MLAPDLVGFGKSDKPAAREDDTHARHVRRMTDWLSAVGASDVNDFIASA